ncbi:MAG: response regulator, partial [Muribaculaceae bacterium]|nr:response regulator [Muribaculaceae bacterium]
MILIADDDNSIRISLSMLLRKAGYEVKAVGTPAEAIECVRAAAPQLVMLDMNFTRATSGDEGLTLLRQIKLFRPDVPVILITAWGSIPLAVEGVRSGAFDFITKPWDNHSLLQRVATAVNLAARPDTDAAFDRSRIIGNSPALMQVLDTVRRVAATDAPVLIMGENGTGKELIAETIHANSRRAAAPFVKVNLGGISRSL